jgi:hypothetical protein
MGSRAHLGAALCIAEECRASLCGEAGSLFAERNSATRYALVALKARVTLRRRHGTMQNNNFIERIARASGRARSTASLMLMVRPGCSFHFQTLRRECECMSGFGRRMHARTLSEHKYAHGLNSSDPSNGLEQP